MKEVVLEAKTENLDQLLEVMDQELKRLGCPPKKMKQVKIAIEEVFINICSYAYDSEVGKVIVRIESDEEYAVISVQFVDEGKPFNPLENSEPDFTKPFEERDVGGLGIFMVKKYMDEVTYEYRDNQNILSMKKKISLE